MKELNINGIVINLPGLKDLEAFHMTALGAMDDVTVVLERKYFPLCAM